MWASSITDDFENRLSRIPTNIRTKKISKLAIVGKFCQMKEYNRDERNDKIGKHTKNNYMVPKKFFTKQIYAIKRYRAQAITIACCSESVVLHCNKPLLCAKKIIERLKKELVFILPKLH